MTRTVTLIPGDGIGPEVVEATLRLLEGVGADIEWEPHRPAWPLLRSAESHCPRACSNRSNAPDSPSRGR